MYIGRRWIVNILLILFAVCINTVPGATTHSELLFKGNAVQVDPTFDYYEGRSAESIASEISLNGYNAVHLLILDERELDRKLIESLHDQNIAVWACFFATSIYSPRDLFPPESSKWLMQTTTPPDDPSYVHFSFIHDDYREWMKKRIVRILKEFPFDGVVMMEAHYPFWEGLDEKPVYFGDVSPTFKKQFMMKTGNNAFPNFTDPSSARYYERDEKLFSDLVDFRVSTINDFFDDIYNGPRGVREEVPHVTVCTWSLAVSGKGNMDRLRIIEGVDAAAMVEQVKPDMHYFQTHYPDWTKPQQFPRHVHEYARYIHSVQNVAPALPLGIQDDIGSLVEMRRPPWWREQFEKEALAAGLDTQTWYEFSIRWEVYRQPPQVRRAIWRDKQTLELRFDQRLSRTSSAFAEKNNGNVVKNATSDGNILSLELRVQDVDQEFVIIDIGELADSVTTRHQLNMEDKGQRNTLPKSVKVKVYRSIGDAHWEIE